MPSALFTQTQPTRAPDNNWTTFAAHCSERQSEPRTARNATGKFATKIINWLWCLWRTAGDCNQCGHFSAHTWYTVPCQAPRCCRRRRVVVVVAECCVPPDNWVYTQLSRYSIDRPNVRHYIIIIIDELHWFTRHNVTDWLPRWRYSPDNELCLCWRVVQRNKKITRICGMSESKHYR